MTMFNNRLRRFIVLAGLAAAYSSAADVRINNTNVSLAANARPVDTVKNPTAISQIPKNFHFVHPGEFTVAVSGMTEPPLAVMADDNKTLIGSEPDIARLIADSLGLKLNIVQTSWDDWPLGVSSGRYDAAISNITVTRDRKQKFDFATYRKDLLAFYVKDNSPLKSITKAADIAGLKIIVGSGTNQEAILLAWDKENRSHGLAPFTPVYMPSGSAESLALLSGRADAYFGPHVLGAWKSQVTGQTRFAGAVDGGWPKAAHIAVTMKKGNGLDRAVQTALNGVINNGDYQKVLNRWGEGLEALPSSEINPPGLGD
ncbi:ABC transporter substrate-binding protein [Tatumella punctata]